MIVHTKITYLSKNYEKCIFLKNCFKYLKNITIFISAIRGYTCENLFILNQMQNDC